MGVARLSAAFAAALALALLDSTPVLAAPAQPPGQQQGKYVRWFYPSQMSYGPIEDGAGNTGSAPAPGAFLTLPFMGPHYITSIFDHCGPNYRTHGKVCRYDGTVASASVGGPDPTFDAGYAQTPGGHDYLYYDGHDGYDYGLSYEPVAAAAPGTVILAGWDESSCHTCLSGLIVEISHGNGLLTFYAHLSRLGVTTGQRVARGQVIGISGMTGATTGPHLHFGVYYLSGAGPVDPYGWSGSSPDPYAKDLGDLWLGGSPRFAAIPMPKVTVGAIPDLGDSTAIDVSWSSPGSGATFALSVIGPGGGRSYWTGSTGPGSAVFHGRPGESYWFWASVQTDLGWTDAGSSPVIRLLTLKQGHEL
jgi:murein DD-endopeptidase MepM/ murein hydrolase activator NlpD